MRTRNLSRLDSDEFDLLVVGGGIYGLACAYDAASRGLRVALVEAGDFGSGASFNHQKTAHGGLRSLGAGQIRLAREGIRERRALARIAPWFLRPLPFLVGTYPSIVRNRLVLRGAFRPDPWLGRHRNDGVEPELHLPAPRLVSKAATLKLFAGIKPEGLTGGAQWYDYQMVESDRLTIAFAVAADRAGADLANHVEALDPLQENGRIARGRADGRLWHSESLSAAEGHEPGDLEASQRYRAGGPGRGRPDAHARALARPCARRHLAITRARRAGRHGGARLGSRHVHPAGQRGLSRPRHLPRGRDAGAPRGRTRAGPTRRCGGGEAGPRDRRSRRARRGRGPHGDRREVHDGT